MTRAHLDKDPHDVAAMFDEVAPKYDRTNTVLSMGQDRRWRKAVAEALALLPGERCLDLAAGTATSSAALARSGATVVGCDYSVGMLREGRGRATRSWRGTRCGCRSRTRPSTPSRSPSACATCTTRPRR
jgi:demethylmenaquinone methyltransferase/2-methoxy-6-polyprenyl-1,4-benzoquinol methylase